VQQNKHGEEEKECRDRERWGYAEKGGSGEKVACSGE